MSTDAPPAPERAHRDLGREPRRSRYPLVVLALLLGLALVAGALAAFTVARGPHIRGVEGDPAALVLRAGSRLVLQADQPLAARSVEGLTVSPATPVTVTVTGSSIEVRFDELLDYGTTYRITAPALVGLYTGQQAALDRDFATPAPDVFTLVRDTRLSAAGVDLPDTVVRHRLTGGEDSVVFSAPQVQEYALTSSLVAAVTLDAEGRTDIEMAELRGEKRRFPLPLPGGGGVRLLRGSGASEYFGFAFTGETGSQSFVSTLFVYDTKDVSGTAQPVLGLDGAPLQVIDWRFVPGTSSLVAQSFDGTFYLIDVTGSSPPQPLGTHTELLGFIPGTAQVAALDPDGLRSVDLTTGAVADVPDITAPEGSGRYPGRRALIDPSGSALQLFSTPLTDVPGGPFESSLVRIGGDEPGEFYRPAAEGSRIRDFCLSPNRQYAAVEVASADSAVDEYPTVGAYLGMTTSIVDVATGETLSSFYGFLPDWCR